MARFEITAPDGSRHEITAPDDASPDQVMEYAKQQFSKMPANKPRSFSPTTPMTTPNVGGSTPLPPAVYDPRHGNNPYPGMDASAENWAQRVAENPFTRKIYVFQDALIPGANRIGSVLEAGIRQLGGSNRTLGEDLKREYAKRNRASDLIEQDFGVTDAPFRSLGWVLGGAALKLPETAIASANYVPQAQQFLNSVVQSIRPNAAFGAMQGGLDSRKDDVPGMLGDTGLGLLGGAVLGPAVPLAMKAAGNVGGRLGDAYRYMTGRGAQARENVAANIDTWKDADVKLFGPALTDNPVLRTTAEKGAGSVLGGALRRGAQGSIDDVLDKARGAIKTGTNGASLNDVGETIQDDLRRALLERSTPSALIKSMPDNELERITGPVGDLGFLPPKPVVEPIQPRQARPFRSEPVAPDAVQFERMNPREVQPPKQPDAYTRLEDIPVPEHWQKPLADIKAQLDPAERQVADLRRRFEEAARPYNEEPFKVFQAAENQIHPLHNIRQQLAKSYDDVRDLRSKFERLQKEIDYDRELDWSGRLLDEDRRFSQQFEQERRRYEQDVVAAQREAAELNARRRAEALQRAQVEADNMARYKYEAEQARLNAEAERGTLRAQELADEQWQKDVINRPGLNPDNTRDSYPTVFDAAYELATRNTPAIQRNPLGSRSDPTPTALGSLLDDIGLEGRRAALVPGYKPGRLFQENGDWAPHVREYISEMVGPDVGRRLDAYASMRKNGQFPPGIQGLRDLRTAVREAAERAERPGIGERPRTKEAATLRRIEGALTDDMYRFMGDAGPKGLTAAQLWKSTDRSYGQDYIQELRKPLAKIYGQNVPPIEALERLTTAAVDGDLRMIRAAMRVTAAKGDKNMLAMGIVANVTKNAQTLGDFVDGMNKLPRDVRAVLSQGEDVAHIMRKLTALEGIAKKLAPYDEAIRGGGVRLGNIGPDLSNPANIAIGVAMISNWIAAMFAVGGSAAIVRFMGSPRYMAWLQRGAAIKDRTQWYKHVQVLMRFADSDKENLGAGIIESIQAMQPETPQPQPQRKPPLPGMMRLGGPKPADLPSGRTPITFSRRAVTDEDRAQAEEYMKNKDALTRVDDPEKGPVDVPWYEALFRESGVLPESLKKQKGPVSWLKEIDDSEVPINEEAMNATRGQKTGIPLEDVIPHQELFNIIPELKGIKIRIGSAKNEGAAGSAAFYDVESKEIVFDEREWMRSGPNERRSVLFHELQHAVDDHEGLPFSKLSEFLADTSGYRSKYDEQTRRDRPPMQIYDHKPSQYIDDVPADPRLIEGWRSHGRPIRDRAVTGNRRPPPGMMNLGGPRDQAPGSFAESPFNEMFAAAAEKGVDYRKASPQDVIDAAWAANPTDGMADAIEKAARQLNLSLPWERRK